MEAPRRQEGVADAITPALVFLPFGAKKGEGILHRASTSSRPVSMHCGCATIKRLEFGQDQRPSGEGPAAAGDRGSDCEIVNRGSDGGHHARRQGLGTK